MQKDADKKKKNLSSRWREDRRIFTAWERHGTAEWGQSALLNPIGSSILWLLV